MIIGSAAIAMLIMGTFLAVQADRHAARGAELECLGGILLAGGLSLIGIGLFWVLGPTTLVLP